MAVYIVDTASDTVNAGDGKLSLREAVEIANGRDGADRIEFASALYGGRLSLTQGQLVVTDDLVIDGDSADGGAGSVTLVAGDGKHDGSDDSAIVRAHGASLRIEDFTLAGRSFYAVAGGIVATDADVALVRTAVTDIGHYSSAGVSIRRGSLLLESSTISDIGAADQMHGISAYDAEVRIIGSRISDLGAEAAVAIALHGDTSSLHMRNSEISDLDGFYTSGILASGRSQSVVVTNSGITNLGRTAGGIGVTGAQSYLKVDRVEISNIGSDFGSGIVSGGRAIVTRSTIAGLGSYYASGTGIGSSGSLTLTNSTIIHVQGGGVVLGDTATAAIAGTTVTGNVGSGLVVPDGARVRLENSLIVDNSVVDGLDAAPVAAGDVDGAIDYSNGHNLFGSAVAGAVAGDLQDVDPLLVFAAIDPDTGGGVLADHGGPTPTVALWDDRYNPALGGADPRLAGTDDQRGVERPRPAGSDPDIGAFELAQSFREPAGRPFDGLEYIASHADLIQAFGPSEAVGTAHYRTYGSDEGRSITFDGLEYIASYPDLIRALGADRDAGSRHFIEFGTDEARPPDDFDAEQYLANYADLQAAFGADTEAATVHFIRYGHGEGRSDEPLSARTAADFLI